MNYLVFAWEFYYPSGGWQDFVGAYKTLDEARQAGEKYVVDCKPNDRIDIVEIIDLNTLSGIQMYDVKDRQAWRPYRWWDSRD